MTSLQLNVFQRGVIQKTIIQCIYFVSICVGVYFLDALDKELFGNTLQLAVKNGIIGQDVLINLQQYIDTRSSVVVLGLLLMSLLCVLIAWLLMCWTSKYNLSWPVTIPEVIEFRPAMKGLGVKSLFEEIALVKKYDIPIFIARKPLVKDIEQNIRAQLYPFASHNDFSAASVFEKYIGSRRLCLLTQDYERILKESQKELSLQESKEITAKEQEIEVHCAKISRLQDELKSAKKENERLHSENITMRNAQKPIVAQGKQRVKRLCKEGLQWAVMNPVKEHLIANAPKQKIYTKREILEAFEQAWEQRPDLQEKMYRLDGNRNLAISEAMFDAVKVDFVAGGLFSTKGGRPVG